ncbi:MAG: DnaD domain protein [Bacilli bacterium]|nr:DnaD domain protein [Bacilli bacterium]
MSNEVIYNIIKNKDYIIRPFLFKIIKENKLDINETLLLIYLTNQEHPELDLKLINKITTLNNEEILSSFSSLTKKGLISTNIIKDDDKMVEEISLDGIYKLAASDINKNTKKEETKNIFELFESEFGRTLSPMEYELINAWINSGMDEELIKEALKEATYNGVSNLRYIDKIIYEWNKKGYKTVSDVKNNRFKKEVKEEKDNYFFEYNWLDEN